MDESIRPFYLEVASGKIEGHSYISKFGQNNAMALNTSEDIWDVGGDYPYPSNNTAPMTHVDSSSASDTGLVEIQGLDIGGNAVTQTKTLNGTTKAVLTTPLWRVFRIKNVGTSTFIGTVQVVNSADNVTYAQVAIGNNQTLMAIYTIPKGKTGYLVKGTASLAGLTNAYNIAGEVFMRPYGQVFQLKNTFGVNSTGSSYFGHEYLIPLKITERTDIKVRGMSSKADGVLNATFEVLLIDSRI